MPIENVKQPVVVSENTGALDALQATLRYMTVIIASGATLLAVLKTRDIAAIIEFMRGTEGAALIAAVIGLGTMFYGIFKTHKRGAQVATVAADSRVPATVAKLK
jgi:hypothetical protein